MGSSREVVTDIEAVVNDIVRATGQARLLLFGHASGGHWAAMYASEHPDKVAGLVLLNSMYGVDAPWGLRRSFENPEHPGTFDASAGPYRLATAEGLLAGWNKAIPTANKDEWCDPNVAAAYVALGLASDPTSSSRTTIPDATHFVFLDRPERGRMRMLREIREFVAGAVRSGSG